MTALKQLTLRWLRSALLLGLLAAMPVFSADGTGSGGPANADPDSAAAREALRNLDPPWYDRDQDGWHRVGVPVAKPAEDATRKKNELDLEPFFIVVVCALVAVVLGVIVAVLMRGQLPDTLPEAEVRRARPAHSNASVLAFVPAAGAHDPEAALTAALAAQDWRAATIWLYALTLLALETAGVLRLDAGKTDRAYVREAARALAERSRRTATAGTAGTAGAAGAAGKAGDRAAARGDPDSNGLTAFQTTVTAFSAVYFGHQPADAASVAVVQRARQTVQQQVGRR